MFEVPRDLDKMSGGMGPAVMYEPEMVHCGRSGSLPALIYKKAVLLGMAFILTPCAQKFERIYKKRWDSAGHSPGKIPPNTL